MGLPTLVRLTHALPYYEELTKEAGLERVPMILVEESTLEQVLSELAQNFDLIRELGEYSDKWVRLTHGSDIIAQKLIRIYEGLKPFGGFYD